MVFDVFGWILDGFRRYHIGHIIWVERHRFLQKQAAHQAGFITYLTCRGLGLAPLGAPGGTDSATGMLGRRPPPPHGLWFRPSRP